MKSNFTGSQGQGSGVAKSASSGSAELLIQNHNEKSQSSIGGEQLDMINKFAKYRMNKSQKNGGSTIKFEKT